MGRPGCPERACSTASIARVLSVLIARSVGSALWGAGGMRRTLLGGPCLRGTGREGLLEVGDERADDLLLLRLGRLPAHRHVLHVARVGGSRHQPAAVDEPERRGDVTRDLEDL